MSLRLPRIRQNVIALGQTAPSFLLYVSKDNVYTVYIQGVFFKWHPPKNSKYQKVNLG